MKLRIDHIPNLMTYFRGFSKGELHIGSKREAGGPTITGKKTMCSANIYCNTTCYNSIHYIQFVLWPIVWCLSLNESYIMIRTIQGRIQDFKLGGGALKKIAPSGGRRENFWGISCEKITILRQKIIFFPIAEGGAKIFGVFRVKNHDFTPKNHFFSNYRGARAGCAPPPWIRPCDLQIWNNVPKVIICNHFVIMSI